MPRPERAVDGEHAAVVEFARDLRRLREAAGRPPYRQMAGTALYSASVLSEAANGRKLPSLSVTRAYVWACEGDVVTWESRWRRLAAELAQTTVPEDDHDRLRAAPYVGLRCLHVEDADRFFGRDRLMADLVDRVRRSRLVVVFGASGSGKSSLLRAGLLAQASTIGLDGAGPTSARPPSDGIQPGHTDPGRRHEQRADRPVERVQSARARPGRRDRAARRGHVGDGQPGRPDGGRGIGERRTVHMEH